MTIIDKLRELNAKPYLGPADLAEIGSALPALLRVAEAARDWSNAEFGQDLNECAALRDAVDALAALEVQNGH